MKRQIIRFVFLLLPFMLLGMVAGSQEKKDSVPSRAHNAGFDVIIKRNGDLVYGLVQEVGPLVIRYKRTDIPDGPIYMLDRQEIYAISYRNQTREVLNPLDGQMPLSGYPSTGNRYPDRYDDPNRYNDPNQYRQPFNDRYRYPDNYQRNNPYDPANRYNQNWYNRNRDEGLSLTRMAMVRFGIGFFRGFSKVKDAGSYSSSMTFPAVSLAYETLLQQNVRVGLQAAFGQNKFTRDEFNDYDSLRIGKTLRERVFTLHAYGRYTVGDMLARLQPYVMGGVGLHTSFIRSEQQIDFLEQNTPSLLVKSGSRVAGLGLLIRGGAEYYLNPQIRVFADAGTGPAIVQIGVGAYLQ